MSHTWIRNSRSYSTNFSQSYVLTNPKRVQLSPKLSHDLHAYVSACLPIFHPLPTQAMKPDLRTKYYTGLQITGSNRWKVKYINQGPSSDFNRQCMASQAPCTGRSRNWIVLKLLGNASQLYFGNFHNDVECQGYTGCKNIVPLKGYVFYKPILEETTSACTSFLNTSHFHRIRKHYLKANSWK
jgi:hypothetical protein